MMRGSEWERLRKGQWALYLGPAPKSVAIKLRASKSVFRRGTSKHCTAKARLNARFFHLSAGVLRPDIDRCYPYRRRGSSTSVGKYRLPHLRYGPVSGPPLDRSFFCPQQASRRTRVELAPPAGYLEKRDRRGHRHIVRRSPLSHCASKNDGHEVWSQRFVVSRNPRKPST